MGREREKVFTSFTFPAHAEGDPDPRMDFNTMLDKFTAHFVPKRNIIHERRKFYARSQVQGESVERYLRCLYDLVANCNFDNEEETLRDRSVLGLLDSEVSQKLQLEDKLTLQAAVDTARHHELVKAQLRDQRNHSVSALRAQDHSSAARSAHVGRGRGRRGTGRGGATKATHENCGKCDRKHGPDNCPAKGKRRRKCNKLLHFAAVCRSKKVCAVDAEIDAVTY